MTKRIRTLLAVLVAMGCLCGMMTPAQMESAEAALPVAQSERDQAQPEQGSEIGRAHV